MREPTIRLSPPRSIASQILVIGLTSAKPGNLEFGNLGNYMIVDPLFAGLRAEFPRSKIRTSLQLSDAFCKRYDIISLRGKRFWSYGKEAALETARDAVRIAVWRLLNPIVGARMSSIIKRSALLSEIQAADLVIDFSGDIFGNNASYNRFLEACAEILFARIMGKPVAMLAGSPGPFSGWRRPLARFLLNRVSLITNREPISTELLTRLGIDDSLIKDTACPAFLFRGKTKDEVQHIFQQEGIDLARPTVGLIVSGWNMPEPPYDRVPRQEWELEPFIDLVEFLLEEIKAQVVLMSHSHRLNAQGQLVFGPDAVIARQIYEAIQTEARTASLILLSRPYAADTTKAIIGTLDMLVSGRLHGAVSGLSQGIPTVIVDYGHEPRAHKLRGVARMLDIGEYVCNPTDSTDMIQTVSRAWLQRAGICAKLSASIALTEARALRNFEALRTLL